MFLAVNLIVSGIPLGGLGRISAYNSIFPGRERFPFGENSQVSYNLSLYNLDAMFASHQVSAAGSAKEFRVFVVGDSSIWGILLKPGETLSEELNGLNLRGCENQLVHFYNLGYPTLSLTKDLMILEEAKKYHPDLILWAVTLESFSLNRQIDAPLVANNPGLVRELIRKYQIPLNPYDPRLVDPNFWDRTLIGQRRSLADLYRLQLYGVLWAATGIDQDYPATYPAPQRDFKAGDDLFMDFKPPQLPSNALGYSVLKAGYQAMGKIPVWIINEPIMVSSGANNEVRYNFYYPRWAYDQYRAQLGQLAQEQAWPYLDAWNLAPEEDFTNTAIHMNPAGTKMLAETAGKFFEEHLCH